MEVSFDKQQYSIDESTSEEIDYFDIKTPKVVIEGEEVYWCPFEWDWRLINHKEQMEKRYKNCMKTIYFNEKLFLVEKKVMRKHFKDGKLVDVCLLPIGIYVYWDINSEQWDFLGYK
tara:strand:+ start:5996 stop:6346 length:351 start_codon:yes stop_codon:yes gene_type:complete